MYVGFCLMYLGFVLIYLGFRVLTALELHTVSQATPWKASDAGHRFFQFRGAGCRVQCGVGFVQLEVVLLVPKPLTSNVGAICD